MKRIVISLLFLLSFVSAFAQGLKQRLVGTTSNISIVSFVPNTSYTIQFNLASFQGYSGAQVQVGDQYVVEYTLTTPKKAIRFQINSVSVVSGNRIQVTMSPLDGATLLVFPVTTGEVYRSGAGFNLIPVDGAAPMFLEAAIHNHNTIKTDSLLKNHQDSINAILATLGGTGGGSTPLIDSLARTAHTDGLTPQFYIPFGNVNSRLDYSANLQFSNTQLQTLAYLANGTGGNGYFEMVAQSGAPSTPASGFRMYADATGRFSWKPQSDGFIRTFNGALTTDRVYSLPNASGTFGLLESSQTWSGTNTFTPGIVTGNITMTALNRTIASSGLPLSDIWVGSVRSLNSFHSGGGSNGLTFNNNSQSLFRAWDNGNFLIQFGGTYTDFSGSLFTVNTTTKYALGDPRMTTVQRDALGTLTEGGQIFNLTTHRPNFWNGSAWIESIGVASGGLTNTWVGVGDASGNIGGSAAFTFDATNIILATNTASTSLNQVIDGNQKPFTISSSGGSGGWIGGLLVYAGASGTANTIPAFRIRGNSGASAELSVITIGNISEAGASSAVSAGTTLAVMSNVVAANAANFDKIQTNSFRGVYSVGTGKIGWAYTATFNATPGTPMITNSNSYGIGVGIQWQPKANGYGTSLILGGKDDAGVWQEIARFSGANKFVGVNTPVPNSTLDITPEYSWTGDLAGGGYGLRLRSATYTNTTTAASGTVAVASIASFEAGPIASTNTGVVYTDAATLRISGAPTAGTNSTITNSWALLANGPVFAGRIVLSQNVMYAVGSINSYRTTANLSSYNSNGGGNRAGIASQLHLTTTGNVGYGVMGAVASGGIANAQGAGFFSEAVGNSTNGASSNLSGLHSVITTEGGYLMNGALIDLYLYSAIGGGSQSNSVNGVYVRPTGRNNAGSTNVRGFYYSGLPADAGSNTTITNHNPLALVAGSVSNVTNTWSYIDHNITIGSASNTAASALVELVSTTKGFLPSRLTTVQRDAVSSPATALWIYNTTTNRPNYWNGSAWVELPSIVAGGIGVAQIPYGDASGNLASTAHFNIFGLATNRTLRFKSDPGNTASGIQLGVEGTITGSIAVTNTVTNGVRGLILSNEGGTILLQGSHDDSRLLTPTALKVGSAAFSTQQMPNEGARFHVENTTTTNTITAASGTLPNVGISTFAGGTIASTNTGVTYTNAATLRIVSAPVAGTNSTITNSWAIQVAAGNSSFPRAAFGPLGYTYSVQNGIGHNYLSQVPLFSYTGQMGTSGAAIIGQGQAGATGLNVFGVLGNLAYNSHANLGNSAAIRGETGSQEAHTSGNISALYGYFRTGGGSANMFGLNIEGDISKSNTYVSAGYLALISAGVSGRNNAGLNTLRGVHYSGVPGTISGGGGLITTHNPLAISNGSTNSVTNTWSYIDHATTIGSGNQTHASAVLELISTTQGFLPSRMTTVQRDAITSPATGLSIYNLTTNRWNYYNGAAWVEQSSVPSGGIGSNQIAYGDGSGGLTSVPNFTFNSSTQQLTLPAVTGMRGTSLYTHIFNAGGSAGNISLGFGQDPTVSSSRMLTLYQVTTGTSGAGSIGTMTFNPQYVFSGGTTALNAFNVNPGLNFTGTYVGTVRGIYYNPTVTSMIGVTHRAWESTSGDMIVNGGSISTNNNLTVSNNAAISGAITATGNNHRFGWLMVLTSGTAGATGQAIRVSGPDQEFELQGTGGSPLNTFSFANYTSKTGMRGMLNTNSLNSFVRIYGGLTTPNANNLSGAVLAITPQYSISSSTGNKVTGVYYDPTLTNMTGVATHNAWESTSGDMVINGGRVSIGSSTIPSAVAFQVVANNRMTIPAPVMSPSLRDLMTGVQAGMVYSSTSDEYQYFDATGNQFVGIVKKGADAFFADQAIIYAQNPAGENIVDSDADFKYNAGTGTMSMLAEYSKINMFREPSDTDLDAAVTVKAYDKSSDANYFVRLLKGVDGVGSGLEDSVQIVMYDGNLLLQANTESLYLSAENGIVSTEGTPFVQHRTQHNGSGALQLNGRQNVAFISASATYSSITLPEIVSGTPGLNQVRIGHILQLIIINASSFTINAGAATAIYEHATSTTPVASVPSTGGQTYARTFIAADSGKWVIVGN